MKHKIELSPSLMTMNLDKFKEEIEFLNDNVNSYHIDIMDGHFVPNITLSPWFIEQVRKVSDVPLSAHLMVTDASFWVEKLIDIKCEFICMPAEVINGVAFRLIDEIHDAGLKAGVVLNPETPISAIQSYIDLIDKITIMTVDPGYAGQRFLKNCLNKVSKLRKLREENGYTYELEIDGSTNIKHWKLMSDVNPDIYVIGRSGLFGLTENIESSWGQMVEEYEKSTGYKFNNGIYVKNN
ncbi:D-allulose 6-phosphate 3-epimerase [Liquorilactobacillus mali]|uniref:Putative D-allulose-6-phosphate 3-epimerase n=1 Tax=Liquorilactobacillus mali TaxID=1618 RepID=A0A0R2FNB5_9LACO|nr:D-allulose 6-phosphate 3-epimerase [Liquorilactobacillus mali]KRN30079.1 ribulose-phosphate 3-epimerase [Liquorilactobacillus mali]MDN7144696.1 D-allulose 6-phosphate 3-epimerase [Liquorilactobacillus mali]